MELPPLRGGCLCGAARYEITTAPLTLYACHCTDCQTASGASFTLTLVVPAGSIAAPGDAVRAYPRPRSDGGTKDIFRCATCLTALWGVRRDRPELATVYAGTLDDSSTLAPAGHIFTRSAQPWIAIPDGALRYEGQPPDMLAFVRAWRARRGARDTAS